ncbi:MAG TPA: glucoamylase family protein [Longimicrobium sp.]|nr:glucoamylase family protein [Longimicrobium sp.]
MPDDGSTTAPLRIRTLFAARVPAGRDELLSGPIRGELLGADQLADKARDVAGRQHLADRPRPGRGALLLSRLTQTRALLDDVYARLGAGADRDVDVGPAGEWLLDNAHVVREHIREVRATLPPGYYRELPELADGPLAGYPRVYELAITLISHTESRVDLRNLEHFVAAFQAVAPLRIGELWAVPAMLRLALLESVRRMALRTVQRMDEMENAGAWAARIGLASGQGTEALGDALDAFAGDPPPLTPVFVSRFLHQLRLTRGAYPPLAQIEHWIGERALGAEDAAARSTQHLALTQVVMAHSITSLRTIAHLDWAGFVERQSAMDAVLREDPSGFYGRMTFATRDRYRHAVERIARRTGLGEQAVAAAALDRARAALADGGAVDGGAADGAEPPLRAHVGWHLVDDGLPALEAATGYRPSPLEALHRWVLRHPDGVFGGATLAGTAAALAAVLWLAGPAGRAAWPLVLVVALLPAFNIALSAVNQLLTAYLPPRVLPKLELKENGGIPAALRTAVVVPTLFPGVAAVHEALENLEVQFLANRQAHLHFAVLSDFTDAAAEHVAGDDAIVAAAEAGVRALNARYAPGREDAFYLFHRPRRWNPRQGVWMGWERKRGKLAQFNHFLRGNAADAFHVVVGDVQALRGSRYVITLDADTVLPPGAAPDLVGALAHPLNRAVYDAAAGRVVRGYGILQPRVGVSLPSAHRSRFAAIHSGHPGVDPYTVAVSDVYQDLYGEGSFTGKGIYEVDAFEQATHGRFPENTLLSHDLVEGSYARAGLATEISVYDDYPTRYLTWTRRKHRWVRGDWQLLRWLTPRVAGPDGPEPNRLPALARWKILDNLRRSTVEIGQLAFLAAGWTLLPGSPLRWTVLGLLAIAAPWIVSLLLAALRPPLDRSWRAYYAAVGRDALTSAQQVGLAIAFLPHQAWVSADAIARTLWRLFVSKRSLLEWQTASGAEHSVSGTAAGVWRAMVPALAVAGALGLAAALRIVVGDGPAWTLAAAAGPLLALWMASPAIAHALSAPAIRLRRPLTAAQRGEAMRLALLHWRFFDRFVGPETHGLVPDNFQEDPAPVVAMRTSPTNIGLQLLATGSAYDLGFITRGEMVRRLETAFRALERLRRHRGHFFNWYDLNDLRVLEPAYVSTVDSGNLAGHLVALRQACLAARDAPGGDARLGPALRTALRLAEERLRALAPPAPPRGAQAARGMEAAAARVRTAHTAWAAAAETVAATGSTGSTGSAGSAGSAGSTASTGSAGSTAGQMMPADAALAALEAGLREALAALDGAALATDAREAAGEWIAWSLDRVAEHRAGASAAPADEIARLEALAARADRYVAEMDFRFLFDEARELFSIGYGVAEHTLDPSYYDLLASESRLASFIAIAKGDAPVDHWFRLGRSLTHAGGETALVSWSGSMFEYLMPALVMRSLPHTLLDQTYAGAVRRQVAYGVERGVPWGVSESAYNLRDRHLTYQYRAFGVPDLALKRGLGRDLVIAPYASALAVMVAPRRALANLAALEKKGALGPYGFRDALDYTRPDPERRFAVVGNYMAHHVGMGLAALTNALTAQVWQERFHADPLVRSAELLLHERIPRRLVVQEAQATRADEALPDPETENPAVREFDRPDTSRPHIALLGRAPYTLMVSHCGSGYSRYEELAVTRWRADGTSDATGQFCYLKDVESGRVWSAAHQPVCAPADDYRALLATDRVSFHRSDGGIETRTEIAVVPEDAAEVRCVTVTNRGAAVREIELTSYGEIVLGPPDANRAHPAFANLFVETEWHAWCAAVTATRRPRAAGEPALWCVHVVDGGHHRVGPVTCETDRARFIGRGGTTRDPLALTEDGPLSCTVGAVLDPVFALRTRVRLEPGQSASVAFTTLVATTRERAFELAGRYHDSSAAQRALDLAWTSQQVELRELGLTPAHAAVFQELAGALLYPRPELRASQAELVRNQGAQPLLWAAGISGDWPVVLAAIDTQEGLPTLRQLFAAHRYWRRRGMTVDLVVLNTQPPSYLQELQDRIMEAMFASGETELDRPGGVFVRRMDQLDDDTLLMLRGTARLSLRCDGRTLAHVMDAAMETDAVAPRDPGLLQSRPRALEQHVRAAVPAGRRIRAHHAGPMADPAFRPPPGRRRSDAGAPPSSPPAHASADRVDASAEGADASAGTDALRFDNGYGGLRADGDYEVRVRGGFVPPAPWVNVVANPHGGFIVSERGAGFTWAGNSYFFRLTPWHNDPVSDPPPEVLYLRDEDSGDLWSATPAPVRVDTTYTVRHGAGESVFACEHGGIATRLTLAMAEGEAARLSLLRVTNAGDAPRRIGVTAYVEWALGVLREHTQHQVQTRYDGALGAVLASNAFDPQFAGWTAYCALSEPVTAHTADRREFLGRNGSLEDPAALRSAGLAGTTGAGHDPCAALQCLLELAPGETREIAVLLGAAEGEAQARAAILRYREAGAAAAAAAASVAAWKARLSVVTVRTPEPGFDAMLNRWTLYQALGCRMWARSALYQSSGAYGFRDQLQDVLAFVYAEPAVAREHLLRAAARQFTEGDVQHWWHPQSGRGVRTRFSDDLAWLPFVVDGYVAVTGDASVLDEYVPFLAMRPLEPHEHEVYELPQVSDEHASVYEHCLRALRRACTAGAHGLPLIGIGDWNDGMNRVGVEGRGESVWLAWFLVTTLRAFALRAEARGDEAVAAELRARADGYVAAAEAHGWDGAWYRRAYFDDGTPLGSRDSDECRIDSIAQSWSVISGAGAPDRQAQAMRSLEEHLVLEEERMLVLLAPPFDRTPHDPGYIKGYLPGVRENGAQYTHAALWAVLATALRGDGDRAFDLYQMLNPLTHTASAEGVERYRVEPYVVAADVYTAAGQVGRGGWTWYTGSASWMYRVGLESILGFVRRGDTLRMEPCVPGDWAEFGVDYRFGGALYAITVQRPAEIRRAGAEVTLDGRLLDGASIPLLDDGIRHDVLVRPRTPSGLAPG